MKVKTRKVIRIIWFGFVAIFMIWQAYNYQARGVPEGVLISNDEVIVTETVNEITFTNGATQKTHEIIFFQGGLVDPDAYAPLCRKITQSGFTCHLMKMPSRLPVYYYQDLHKMIDLKAKKYIIGGHSQGGKMASQFVYENPKLLKGLFLLGTSHPRDINLAKTSIPTIKLYAENDGLASVPEVMENKGKLPINAELVLVEGGNHSQFGYMGKLLTDDDATITLEKQQEITLKNLIRFFESIENSSL